MKFKIIIVSFIIFAFSVYGEASKNELKARAFLYAAEASFEEKNYTTALTHLVNAENILGKRIAPFVALEIKTRYELQEFKKVKSLLDEFYELNSSKTLQKEMAKYLAKIDDDINDNKFDIAIVSLQKTLNGVEQSMFNPFNFEKDDNGKPVKELIKIKYKIISDKKCKIIVNQDKRYRDSRVSTKVIHIDLRKSKLGSTGQEYNKQQNDDFLDQYTIIINTHNQTKLTKIFKEYLTKSKQKPESKDKYYNDYLDKNRLIAKSAQAIFVEEFATNNIKKWETSFIIDIENNSRSQIIINAIKSMYEACS